MTYIQTLGQSINIKGNIIDQGVEYDLSNIVQTFNYTHCAFIYGSANITDNTFANPAAAADMLNTQNGSCQITNNKFIRSATSISSYIKHRYIADEVTDAYSGVHTITDNVFDQPTIDGTTEELVKGLNINTIYTRNKNQTGFAYIPIYDNNQTEWTTTSLDSAGVPATFINFGVVNYNQFDNLPLSSRKNYDQQKQQNLRTRFFRSAGDTSFTDFTFTYYRPISLKSYVENGCSIISARVGSFFTAAVMPASFTGGDFFGVKVSAHKGSDNMNAATSTITPAASNVYAFKIDSSAQLTALKTSTQYTNLASGLSTIPGAADGDYNGFIQPDYFKVGNGYDLQAEFAAFVSFTAASDTTTGYDLHFTPIEIKFRW